MVPRTPLVKPGKYFEDHPDPIIPGLAAFGTYIVASIVLGYVLSRILWAQAEGAPQEAIDAFYNTFWGAMIISIPLNVVALFVVAGIMHLWVRSESSFGTFGGALAVAAWSYAPEIVGTVVSVMITGTYLSLGTFDGSNPDAFASDVGAMFDVLGPLGLIVPLLVALWSIYILAVGVEQTHDVPLEDALWPAAIIAFGSLILQLI